MDVITSLKISDFNDVSKEIGRSKEACYTHWQKQILPILKTDILKLHQGTEWMEAFCKYIVENKITNKKQIPYNHVSKDICPGQTPMCIQIFANNIAKEWKDGKRIVSQKPFNEQCFKQLQEPDPHNSLAGNEEKRAVKMNYINDILEIKTIISKGL